MGICLGFQDIVVAASRDPTILSSFDSWNYTVPLNLTDSAVHSFLFGEPCM